MYTWMCWLLIRVIWDNCGKVAALPKIPAFDDLNRTLEFFQLRYLSQHANSLSNFSPCQHIQQKLAEFLYRYTHKKNCAQDLQTNYRRECDIPPVARAQKSLFTSHCRFTRQKVAWKEKSGRKVIITTHTTQFREKQNALFAQHIECSLLFNVLDTRSGGQLHFVHDSRCIVCINFLCQCITSAALRRGGEQRVWVAHIAKIDPL